MEILVTGSSGFIGYHLSRALLEAGHRVVGVDNHNAYYDVSLKEARKEQLKAYDGFTFKLLDLKDKETLMSVFESSRFEVVYHMAAQAGVRYSLENPDAYVDANLVGFMNILEACRHHPVQHLIYASSSSVYGGNTRIPFSTDDDVDHPVSLYAATKKSNELLAHAYSHLYGLPATGLRFFTVYGSYGRPDMAYYTFTEKVLNGEPIDVYNYGDMERDFTYIDDVVEGMLRLREKPPKPNPEWKQGESSASTSFAPYKVYNIGNNTPVSLERFINVLEDALGRKADKRYKPMQPGDVQRTYADIDDLERDVGYRPDTPIETGIERFVAWYKDYHGID